MNRYLVILDSSMFNALPAEEWVNERMPETYHAFPRVTRVDRYSWNFRDKRDAQLFKLTWGQ